MQNLNKMIKAFERSCTASSNGSVFDSKPIYHFTNIESFREILTSRQLRFTYCRHLNDSHEMDFALSVAENHIKRSALPNKGVLIDYLKGFLAPENSNINIFICSFSKNIQHLPLWRFYGADGLGVAIGFDASLPLEDGLAIPEYKIPALSTVSYGEKCFGKSINKKIKSMENIFMSEPFQTAHKEEQCKILMNLYCHVSCYLISRLATAKHQDYKTEEEIRCLLMDGKLRDLSNFPDGCFFEYKLAADRSMKYKTLDSSSNVIEACLPLDPKKYVYSPLFKKEAVKEIYLGPRCDKSLADNIQGFLDREGYPKGLLIKQFESSYIG